jgi:hypothetical protein
MVAMAILGGAGAADASSPSTGVAHATAGLLASPTSLTFPDVTVGDVGIPPLDVTVSNNGSGTAAITFAFGGPAFNDFGETDNCSSVAPGASCVAHVFFVPGAVGLRQATLTPNDGSSGLPVIALQGTGTEGYYETTAQGAVVAHGDAQTFGDTSGTRLARPIVASATTGDDAGYWLVAADGGIFTFGDAGYFGSTGAVGLNKPIVGMAATPDGGGYWLVASDGGIFTFGDAGYFGSTGALHLNKPIVGMAATPDGGGYWLMASDGGLFTFGDAPFDGSSAGTSPSTFVSIAGDAPPTVQAFLGQPAVRRGAARPLTRSAAGATAGG